MVNRQLFIAKSMENGYSQVGLAEALGVDPSTLSMKVNNKRPFTIAEVEDVSKLLKLTVKDRNTIFFG